MTALTKSIIHTDDDKYNNSVTCQETLIWGNNSGVHAAGCGLRFQNVTIPKGAVINSAHLHVKAAWNPGFFPVYGHITCEAADNPGIWVTTTHLPWDCTKTSASVQWDFASMTQGSWYQSPDFANVLKEVTDRSGWASGNALCVCICDDGSTAGNYVQIVDYGTTPADCAYIDVDYTSGFVGMLVTRKVG